MCVLGGRGGSCSLVLVLFDCFGFVRCGSVLSVVVACVVGFCLCVLLLCVFLFVRCVLFVCLLLLCVLWFVLTVFVVVCFMVCVNCFLCFLRSLFHNKCVRGFCSAFGLLFVCVFVCCDGCCCCCCCVVVVCLCSFLFVAV